ncbi:MAG: winged helix-turn-helix domain-containing protein, partial [Psychrosphaera sp.]|nr:winged helix-turn-helix domain-containing protein [Psychrosphaera sp.]
MTINTDKTPISHELYFDSATAMLRFNEQCVRLDPKTFQLLCYFVAHQDQVVERKTLISSVWHNHHASDASLDRLISVLRRILATFGHKFIFTIHKIGYRFVVPADVRFIAANPMVTEDTSANDPFSTDETADAHEAAANEPLIPGQSTPSAESASLLQKSYLSRHSVLAQLGFALLVVGLLWLLRPFDSIESVAKVPTINTGVANTDRIAILPFKLLSQQTEDGLFAEGLTTELLNRLTKIKGLSVVERRRSFKFASNPENLTQVGKELDVHYLLKGNIRKQQNKLRISVELIDAELGTVVFSNIYERQIKDCFAVQTEIALQIAAALRLTL